MALDTPEARVRDATPAGRDRQHLCIFTTAHPTDDVRVNTKIASSFLDAGFRVSWIGPERAYFTASPRPDDRIDYMLLPPGRSKAHRLASAAVAATAARRLRGVDWWYAPDPDAAAALTAWTGPRDGRVLFDVHELFHGALLDRWLPRRGDRVLREGVRRWIARTCRRADLVIGVNRSVLEPYVGTSDRALVVRNCAPAWFGRAVVPARRDDQELRVVHGKITPSNGTSIVLDALSTHPMSGVRVLMQNVGGPQPTPFVAAALERLAEPELQMSVEVLPGVPHDQMPALFATADVGMIAYGRRLGEDSLPNRLFEYMAAGLAILAPHYAVEVRRIVEEERIGVTADFEDPVSVADRLRWLRDHPRERREMGQRARTAFLERHSWDREFAKLLSAMDARP